MPGSTDKSKALGGNVFSAGIVSLLMDISSEMLYPLVPLFLASVVGANKSVIGLIEGLAEATAGVLKTYSGWLSDRIGKRKLIMAIGYGVSTLSRPLMATAGSSMQVLVARIVDRTGKGVRGAPRDALIADSTAPETLGRAFGFHRAMDTMGAAIGPLLATLILAYYAGDYRLVFWMSLIPGGLAVLAIIFFIKDTDPASKDTRPARLTLSGFDWRFKAFLAIATVFSIGNISTAFIVLRAQSLGVATLTIPIMYLCFNLTYALSSYPAGVIADRIGRGRMILTGYLFFTVIFIGFAGAAKVWHLWALFVLFGVFNGMTEGVYRAYITTIVPSEYKGTAFGLYNTLTGLAAVPASVAAGLLWDRFGPWAAFVFGAGMAAVASVLFMMFLRRDARTCHEIAAEAKKR